MKTLLLNHLGGEPISVMAEAADEQRRVLVAASAAATQKTREGALKSV